jgi:hypothetical protein
MASVPLPYCLAITAWLLMHGRYWMADPGWLSGVAVLARLTHQDGSFLRPAANT